MKKKRKVTHCTGEGHGWCTGCTEKGLANWNWMHSMYKIEGIEGCYCLKCAKEILGAETMGVI